jgi:deoxyribonuclease V
MIRTGAAVPGTELTCAGDPKKAQEIQKALRHRCIVERTTGTGRIRYVAGADAAYEKDTVYAAVVVLAFPDLGVVETACAARKVAFPYIPGLLSFREGPAVLDAFYRLKTVPDLLLLNGHGYAHPERFGIASHVGVILDIPSVGIAQRLLTGSAAFPDAGRGSVQPVLDKSEVIGMAVRTKEGSKPVFVSAGHRVNLELAVEIALKTTTSHRITEPVWHADQLSRQCRERKVAL